MKIFEFKTETGQCICDASHFPLLKPTPELFSEVSEELAKELSQAQILVEKRNGINANVVM